MKHFFLFCSFLLCANLAFSQTHNIDSLLTEFDQESIDSIKVELLRDIASHYFITQPDSCPHYANLGLDISKRINYTRGKIHHLNVLGNYYERVSEYDKALEHYNEALEIGKKENFESGTANLINNIANVYTRTGKLDEALKLYFESLEEEEKVDNQKGIAEAYNNIGVVYYYQQDIVKTLFYMEKAIAIEEQFGYSDVLKKGYNNLGALFNYQGNYEKSLLYYHKSYAISQQLKDQKEIGINLNNIAIAHKQLDQVDSSEYYLKKSYEVRAANNDFEGIAYVYINYASVCTGKKQYAEAESYYQKCLDIAKEKDLKIITSEAYLNLAKFEKIREDDQKAYDYLMLHLAAKDSVFSEQKYKAIAEVESKYQTAVKEKEILRQQAEIDQQNLDLSHKNNQLILVGSALIILLLLGFLWWNHQRLRSKQLEKERELEKANLELETQKELQQQRLNISRDLHDNIGAQLTFVISSLDNLKYGFQLERKLEEKLANTASFTTNTIQELRDTIWAMNKDEISFEDLRLRIQTFLSKAQAFNDGIDFQFNVAKEIAPHSMPSEIGMNIYRIIQEAVNNSLKHAKASTISVDITGKEQQLLVQIQDNGLGFDLETAKLSNGLHNMRKRGELIQGTTTIQATPNQGCTIRLEIPFPNLKLEPVA